MTKTAFASSYGVLLTAHIPSGDGGIQRVWAEPEAVSTNIPASRASPVVIVLNLIVAKETDLIAALTRPEVLVGHVHVLHTQGAACHDSVGLGSDFMSVTAMDSLASPCRSGSGDARVVPLWARAHGETHNHCRPSETTSTSTAGT